MTINLAETRKEREREKKKGILKPRNNLFEALLELMVPSKPVHVHTIS